MSWEQWAPAIVSSGVVAIATLAGGYFLKAFVEKGVQHGFDREIEKLRVDLRNKEAELKDIRIGALTAMKSRHEELDRRRIKAAEALWTATVEQSLYSIAVSFAMVVNIVEVDKTLAGGGADALKMRQFAEGIWNASGLEQTKDKRPVAETERLFVAPAAWAAFNALRFIVTRAGAILMAAKTGMPTGKIIKGPEEINALIKSVLPHQASYIDKYTDVAMYYLTEELKEKVFKELVKSFTGSDSDRVAVENASEILRLAASKANTELPMELPEKYKIDPPPLLP